MKYLKNPKLILILILLLGAFLRFYKLDWGNGLYTHPDENTVATSVLQMSFPDRMHPHLFTYGSAITYLIFFTKELLGNFPLHPLIIGRFYSALFSTLTILIVYLISRTFLNKKWALTAAFLTSTTAGLVQQAHFATPETFFTFFILTALLFLIYFTKHFKVQYIIFSAISFGIAIGTKINAVVFGIVYIAGYLLKFYRSPLKLLGFGVLTAFIIFATFIFVSPYVIIDFSTFRNTILYESKLAYGTSQVFYTRQFIETYPVLFHIEKILIYALSPTLLVTGITGLILTIWIIFQKKSLALLLVLLTFSAILIPNLVLFVKWTRYIAPVFPFFSIFSAILFSKFEKIRYSAIFLVLNLIWVILFVGIYVREDVRVSATKWVEQNISPEENLAVEGANTVDIPNSAKYRKTSLDLYYLDERVEDRNKLINALEDTDYFLIQSRRVFLNHQRLSNLYPKTSYFYDNLFNGQLGFIKIKEFHSFPSIGAGNFKIEIPDEGAEETWSVFDHPVIRIYKKERSFTEDEYKQILNW